jgi:two-component system OmpR family response regulator
LAELFEPDVCILDLTMPGMDGVHLGMHLREWIGVKPVRLVALTGRSDREAFWATHSEGFDDSLEKPADPKSVIAATCGKAAAA